MGGVREGFSQGKVLDFCFFIFLSLRIGELSGLGGVSRGLESGSERESSTAAGLDDTLELEANWTDLDLQSIAGLVSSSQGMPRMIEWTPIGATRNV